MTKFKLNIIDVGTTFQQHHPFMLFLFDRQDAILHSTSELRAFAFFIVLCWVVLVKKKKKKLYLKINMLIE